MKNSFKKAVLLCTAMAMHITSYAISTGGAVAAGLGAAAGVSLLAYGFKKHKRRKSEVRIEAANATISHSYKRTPEESRSTIARATKRSLVREIRAHKKEIKNHRLDLRTLQKNHQSSSIEANNHLSRIQELENMIADAKRKLESL